MSKRRLAIPNWRVRWRRRWQGLFINMRFLFRRPLKTLSRLYRAMLLIPRLLMGEVFVSTSSLRVVVIKANGERIDYGVVSRRLVTQAFVKRLCAEMAIDFSSADEWKWHGSGTNGGSTAEANTNTVLDTEVGTRVAGTQIDTSAGATGNYQTVATITYGGSFSIKEHGLFNASAVGTLFDRHVFSAVNVSNGDSIEFTYDLTVNAE